MFELSLRQTSEIQLGPTMSILVRYPSSSDVRFERVHRSDTKSCTCKRRTPKLGTVEGLSVLLCTFLFLIVFHNIHYVHQRSICIKQDSSTLNNNLAPRVSQSPPQSPLLLDSDRLRILDAHQKKKGLWGQD